MEADSRSTGADCWRTGTCGRSSDAKSSCHNCRWPSTIGPVSTLASTVALAPVTAIGRTVPIGTTGSFPTSGFLIGGTAGDQLPNRCSTSLASKGDGDWTNLHGNSGSTCGAISAVVPPPISCQTQSEWLATVRGRVGYAFDRILFYGTAGAAFGNVQTGLNPPSTFDSTVEAGWTVGAGLEVAFAPNWTAKVEYLFVDLPNAIMHDRRQLRRRRGLHCQLQRKHRTRRRQLQIRPW